MKRYAKKKSETVHVGYYGGVGKGGQEDRRCRGKQRGPPKSHKISIWVPIWCLGAGVAGSTGVLGQAAALLPGRPAAVKVAAGQTAAPWNWSTRGSSQKRLGSPGGSGCSQGTEGPGSVSGSRAGTSGRREQIIVMGLTLTVLGYCRFWVC